MTGSLVAWALAPEWVTPAQAAELLGQGQTESAVLELIDLGAIDAEEDGAGVIIQSTQSPI